MKSKLFFLAFLLIIITISCPAGASAFEVERMEGADRLENVVEVSRAGWDAGEAETVVVAREDDYADALAGVPLAHRHEAPVLLTYRDELPATVEQEVERLEPREVIILGGEKAITPEVKNALQALGSVEETLRFAGDDRYDTAAQIARELHPDGVDTAAVAYGLDFPDALAAGAYAAQNDFPLLLTPAEALHGTTENTLEELGVSRTYALGGTAVIEEQVLQELPGEADATRLHGADRYETARDINEHFLPPTPTTSTW